MQSHVAKYHSGHSRWFSWMKRHLRFSETSLWGCVLRTLPLVVGGTIVWTQGLDLIKGRKEDSHLNASILLPTSWSSQIQISGCVPLPTQLRDAPLLCVPSQKIISSSHKVWLILPCVASDQVFCHRDEKNSKYAQKVSWQLPLRHSKSFAWNNSRPEYLGLQTFSKAILLSIYVRLLKLVRQK